MYTEANTWLLIPGQQEGSDATVLPYAPSFLLCYNQSVLSYQWMILSALSVRLEQ